MAENNIITKSNGRPVIDLTGQKFGRWTVISEAPRIDKYTRMWNCVCECGNIKDINQTSLRQGKSKSCGICESREVIGQKFGRLRILSLDTSIKPQHTRKYICFLCECDCGSICSVRRSELIGGVTISCGCYRKEKVTKHGKHKTPEWISWMNMMMRMTNPNNPHYSDYTGRGLELDDYYRDFHNFFTDLGLMPQDGQKYSIGRIQNNIGYIRGNLRWETATQQANNRRSSRFLTFQNKTLTVAQWERETGIPQRTIHNRVFNLKWSIEKALTKLRVEPLKNS